MPESVSDARFPRQPERLLKAVWRSLAAGSSDAGHPFHRPALATRQGDAAAVRTVVLRRVDENLFRLCCHTDARSPKVAQLRAHPQAAWLFYDPARRIQLRVQGPVELHGEGRLADEQWAASGYADRRDFSSHAGPGAPLPEPGSNMGSDDPDAIDLAARAHFVVIACQARMLDWLVLDDAGHRRVRFAWTGDGWRHAWLTP